MIHRDSRCFTATNLAFEELEAPPHNCLLLCVDILQIDLCLDQTNGSIDLIGKQSWMKPHVPVTVTEGGCV